MLRRAHLGWLFGPWLLLAAQASAQGQAQPSAPPELDSPRWTYEIRGAYFRPDLPLYSTFYGDDHDSYLSVAASYRFRDDLELGAEYGVMKDKGVGVLTESGDLGGSVEYRLDPFHVYANWIFQRERAQRVVPYVGAGLLVMRYEQDVELQPDIEGRTDVGWSARAGVRFRVGMHEGSSMGSGSPYWRSFVFVEAQEMSADAEDGLDLGGDALIVGFRMEFDLP
jgi:hypothetical protein